MLFVPVCKSQHLTLSRWLSYFRGRCIFHAWCMTDQQESVKRGLNIRKAFVIFMIFVQRNSLSMRKAQDTIQIHITNKISASETNRDLECWEEFYYTSNYQNYRDWKFIDKPKFRTQIIFIYWNQEFLKNCILSDSYFYDWWFLNSIFEYNNDFAQKVGRIKPILVYPRKHGSHDVRFSSEMNSFMRYRMFCIWKNHQ